MFQDTPNKVAIRTVWDRTILQKRAAELNRGLDYFGLPGAEIHDLLDWSGQLRFKSGVQIVGPGKNQREDDLETIRQMMHNVMVNDVKQFQLLRGAVEDVIARGQDMDQTAPQCSHAIGRELRFSYDLVNLDFLGGMGYKKHTNPPGGIALKTPRLLAVEQLFVRQRGHEFLLLLTLNVRDTLGDEPIQYLHEVATRFNNPEVSSVVKWMDSLDKGMKHYQLKAWIPLWIRELAEMQQFDCHCFPPIAYEGHEHAKMVHFAFRFRFLHGRDLRVSSAQTENELISLPFIEVRDSQMYYLTTPGNPCSPCTGTHAVTSPDIDGFLATPSLTVRAVAINS